MLVAGAPNFPFYMPGSAPVMDSMEDVIRQRAVQLTQRGYQAGAYIDPGDPYLGRTLSMGNLYYQAPQAPGYHFQQQYVEGEARPPVMLPGSLDSRIALELARQQELNAQEEMLALGGVSPADEMSPRMRAYQAIVEEADRRARRGQPLRRGRAAG